jgi:mono/diheme cytochrome c family protein
MSSPDRTAGSVRSEGGSFEPLVRRFLADIGENVYVGHCSFCHQLDGRSRLGAVPALAGNGAVQAKGPEDVIRVILGANLATGTFAPMPLVGAEMTDQEIADVTDYAPHGPTPPR